MRAGSPLGPAAAGSAPKVVAQPGELAHRPAQALRRDSGRAAARLYGGLTTAQLAGPGGNQGFGFDRGAFTGVIEAELSLGRFGHFEAAMETSVDEYHQYSIRGVGLLSLEFEL